MIQGKRLDHLSEILKFVKWRNPPKMFIEQRGVTFSFPQELQKVDLKSYPRQTLTKAYSNCGLYAIFMEVKH